MSNTHKPVWYRFKDRTEVYQSHNWRLEIDSATQKALLGLPYWTEIQILHNYESDPNPDQDLTIATLSSNVCDSTEPELVPANSKKTKTRKKAVQLPDVSELLSKFVPAGNIPESLTAGSDDPVSDSLD
jgi:hypothetical protein